MVLTTLPQPLLKSISADTYSLHGKKANFASFTIFQNNRLTAGYFFAGHFDNAESFKAMGQLYASISPLKKNSVNL